MFRFKKALSLIIALALISTSLVSAGAVTAASNQDATYYTSDAHIIDSSIIYTVFAKTAGNYTLSVGYTGAARTGTVSVNGSSAQSVSLPGGTLSLSLGQGVNSIKLSGCSSAASITLAGLGERASRGASTLYTQLEAENAVTNATIISDSRTYRQEASEASGRRAVKLQSTGQYVTFTLTEPANAFVMRYSIPDSSSGGGFSSTISAYVGSESKRTLNVNSNYAWVYGDYPYYNSASSGNGHRFFQESRYDLGTTYPAGTTIKIQKDSNNTAAYYTIDLIEPELVGAAKSAPSGSLSITSYGAVANDQNDDTNAFLSCLSAAVQQGREVYIPEGNFIISRRITIENSNVVIRGAGMWKTTITGGVTFVIKGQNVGFYDILFSGNSTVRNDEGEKALFENEKLSTSARNFTAQNIWVEHYKCGMWMFRTTGIRIVGCRIRETYADGINLTMGVSSSVVEQCDFRNTGDDSMALWSSEYTNTADAVRFNTFSVPCHANAVAMYGGSNHIISDNIMKDTVFTGGAVFVAAEFDAPAFEGTITIARNDMLRCGSLGDNGVQRGAICFSTLNKAITAQVNITDNNILNSTYSGITFERSNAVNNVLIGSNTITGSGRYGLYANSGTNGSAQNVGNTITGSVSGSVRSDSGGFTFSSAAVGTKVWFYNSEKWDNVYAYAYYGSGSSATQLLGGWPGTAAARDGSTDWWYVTVPADAAVQTFAVIFNNNDEQSADIGINNTAEVYVTMDAAFATKTAAEASVETDPGTDPQDEETTVWFYNSEGWTNVFAYVYYGPNGSETEVFGGWQGKLATRDGSTDWWYVIVPLDVGVQNFNIIFNNWSVQAATVTISDSAGVYITIDNKFTTKSAAEASLGGTAEPGDDTTTIWFYNSEGWASVYAYAYYGIQGSETKPLGGWPGSAMTQDGDTLWYSIVVPVDSAVTPFNIIFNNNNKGKQSGDAYIINKDVAYLTVEADAVYDSKSEIDGSPLEPILNLPSDITVQGEYLYGISAGEALSNSGITAENATLSVYSAAGSLKSSTDRICTGDVLKMESGGRVYESYTIVIMGDISGDGYASSIDLVALRDHLLEKLTLEGAYRQAADINRSGLIDIKDLVSMKKALAA